MKNGAILITGVGGDIGQSLIKCLKGVNQNLLLGCDTDVFAAGRNMVGLFYHCPPAAKEKRYLKSMEKIVHDNDVKYIFPSTEEEICFFDRHRGIFKKDVTVFINQPDIIRTFLDKYDTVTFLKNNALPHPKTFLLENYNSQISFPVILKPRKGWGGKGLIVAHDKAELNFFKKRLKSFIVQEIVGCNDEEYTISIFCMDKTFYSIAFKRRLGYGSLTKVAELIDNKKIESLARSIAMASRLEGFLNIQCRKTKQEFIPIEINPRFSSTVYLRHCFGFQDAKWVLDRVRYGRMPKYTPKYSSGVAVRTISETFFDLKAC